MKKNYFLAIMLLIVGFASAQIDQTTYRGAFAPSAPMWTDSWTNYDPQNTPYLDEATVVNVTTDITANTTWTTGKTYKISGLIYVRNNATLTIQPGVVVKGVFTNSGTALIVTKGSKLNAIGTAAAPIVFTSAKAAGSRLPGDWGGIVLLGKAGFNVNNGINNIEGITANVNTEYGGGSSPINTDNSGTLKYVRIEFGGYVFSPNNEINGLTMGAVGNGTTIDYVQVSFANDDAFEWFGGSVICKHLVAYRNLDDDFDTDNGYKGIVQYALGIKDPSIADNPSISTSEGFESDNNAAGTASPTTPVALDNTSAIFTNVTMVGPSARALLTPTTSVASGHERPLRLRRETQLKIYNSIFMDFKNNFLFVDGAGTVSNATPDNTIKFKGNILAGNLGTFTGGVNPASLNSWFTTNGNTAQASSAGILALPYSTTNTYLGLDYRPASGSAALTNATFAEIPATLLNPIQTGSTPIVADLTYCKGDIAPQLTATLTTTGVSLRWYTVATNGTFSTVAPTPSTSSAGTKNYYVSQVDASNVESDRVLLKVITNAAPTEVIGAITGVGPVGSLSTVAVGPYVGTNAVFTYSVPAFTNTSLGYFWTVPLGVNIVGGIGTNTLSVNYANVAFGAGAVGSIQVQAVDPITGCKGTAKKLSITKALPAAPAGISMFNKNVGYATPNTAITTYAKYMGTTTPLTLTATASVAASSYEWELPAGVNVLTTGTPVTTSLTYTAEPFFSPASTPSTVGTKYWVITYNTYNNVDVNGTPTTITVSTAQQRIWGNLVPTGYTFTLSPAATTAIPANTVFTYNGNTYTVRTALAVGGTALLCNGSGSTLPTASNAGLTGTLTNTQTSATLNFSGFTFTAQSTGYGAPTSAPYLQYGTVVTSNNNSILVNFAGLTNPATTALYLGVRAKNGVGYSITNNATNADVAANAFGIPGLFNRTYTETATAPTPPSTNGTSTYAATGYAAKTSKLKKLIAAIPSAPSTLKLTNDAINPLTAVTVVSNYIGTTTPLTLTANASATASSYSWELPTGVNIISGGNTNVVTINFAGVAPGTTTLYLGVKAVNGIGSSVTVNAAPNASSTAKLLKVTASVPAYVSAVSGQITGVCGGNTYSYTMVASALANSYVITAPTGSLVTSASNPTNNSNTLSTSDLTFSVTYPANLATLTVKTIVISSVNGVGASLTNKTLTISTAMPSVGNATTGSTFTRCAPQVISVPAVVGAVTYTWTVVDGAVITGGQGTNSVTVDFTAVPSAATTNLVKVVATNGCDVSSSLKSITLTSVSCSREAISSVEEGFSNTKMYPNPTSGEFNIAIDSSKTGDVQMTIYTVTGVMVMNPKAITLEEGTNTINENISSLSKGIYIVKLTDASNNEVMVKKLIKE